MKSLLLEIGTEEIPAGYIGPALESLSTTLLQKLTEARIDHGSAKVFATPRRLAVEVKKVADKQKPLTSEILGPPAKVGLDSKGRPTTAAKKFAEKVGVSVNTLTVKETKKGQYFVWRVACGLFALKFLKKRLPVPLPQQMSLPVHCAAVRTNQYQYVRHRL
ncbi:glycine--tRNA ligase subunit beta [Thermodesulfobacteriota bacterium]